MQITALLQRPLHSLPTTEQAKVKQKLEQAIRDLITNDFSQLVRVLYTVDADENKLKAMLQQHPEQDAALLIATLIWTRTAEKARSREQFTHQAPPDDAERW